MFSREAKFMIGILITLSAIFFATPVFASNTDGTIDTTSKWAWASKIGWVNFGTTNGNIHITDTAITGNAWSDLYGWIKMDPTKGGVINNTNGTLSGYAWNANLGWINFTGVTIDSSGNFSGQATGDNYGTLNFSCDNCAVKTDWRPASSRTECNNGIDDDGDGKTDYPADPGCTSAADNDETDAVVVETGPSGAGRPPEPGGFEPGPSYFMILNNDSAYTTSTQVNVTLRCGSAQYAWLSENNNFVSSDLTKIDCDQTNTYTYSTFNLSAGEGAKTVFAKFCNQWGQCSHHWQDSIIYSLTPPLEPAKPGQEEKPGEPGRPPFTGEQESIFQDIKNYLSSLLAEVIPPNIKVSELPISKLFTQKWLPQLKKIAPSFAKVPAGIKSINLSLATLAKEKWLPQLKKMVPRFAKAPVQPPLEQIVSKKAPRAMSGKPWVLLDPRPTNRLVLAPLPKELLVLAEKMPQVKMTFEKVGIKRMTDLDKLTSISMNLPSLSQMVGLKPTSTLAMAGMKEFKTVPISQLPKNLKEKIPTDIIFTRGANELVDMNVALTLSDTGKAEQKIRTVSGKPLELSVKPDFPVKSVRGYVLFKSRTKESSSVLMPLAAWFDSVIFSEPVLAYSVDQPIEKEIETRLVLQEFTYTDTDKDGIYTASIIAPLPEGEYEILTVMDYEDPDLGMKQIRLVTVVDPEGYVYESIRDQELRIRGSIVSLYWLNKEKKQYELWPATDYQQENPQVTDSRGTYSFLVPEGTYYLAAEAPGYIAWTGKTFRVEQGEGVHYNIELKTSNWWTNIIDWRTMFLIVIGLLLVYNFYKDRKRKNENNT